MPDTLDVVTLRSLVAVAQCGGFHRAARVFHLTQAAVSRHVQRLEATLGVELIAREGRAIRFTADGERFLVHATAILEAHDAAIADFVGHPGTLTIGAMDHAVDTLLPSLVHELRTALPDRRFQVRMGRSARLREEIEHNRLDAAIVLERLTSDPQERGAIPTLWVGGRDFARATDLPSPIPLVLFDHDCGLRRGALDTCAAAGIRHEIVAETPDLTGIQGAVRANLGLTLLPAFGRLPDGVHPVTGLPEPPGVVMRIEVAQKVGRRESRAIRTVLERLVASS